MIWTSKVSPLIKEIDLRKPPVIVNVNKFTEDSAKKFHQEMAAAHNSGQPVIPIVIDSYGGQVYSLMSMISAIESAEIPVATIVEGKAMSCGAVLLTFGEQGMRFADPNATIMIHDVSSGCFGKIEDDYFKKKVFNKKHADWFMDAQEAKKHGLVNHLRVPKLNIKVDVDISFD